jgi:hypothetical protein
MPPASSQREVGGAIAIRRDGYASEAANGYRILFLSLRVGTIGAALGLGWVKGHPTSHRILALAGQGPR